MDCYDALSLKLIGQCVRALKNDEVSNFMSIRGGEAE